MGNINVEIPLERYEQLINIESRVNVVVDLASNHGYMSLTDFLLTLGTEKAIRTANKLEEDILKKYEEKSNDVNGGLFNESE